MKYSDIIFGTVTLDNPVVLEIMNTPSFLRLKKIDMSGFSVITERIRPNQAISHSRYAHSMGVFLLLSTYGASVHEALSGLIHDVSHTAFSHCIDYVLAEGSPEDQSYQDNIFLDYVLNSEIAGILKKHGFNTSFILDDANFPLKEKNLPDLCADRIDYSLRTALIFSEINDHEKNYILDHLQVIENAWVFQDVNATKFYAELFLRLNRKHYAGFDSAFMFKSLSAFLKYALEKKYISEKDFLMDDLFVMSKIQRFFASDPLLQALFQRLKLNSTTLNSGHGEQVVCKSRIVDPLFLHRGQIIRLSAYDKSWAEMVKQEMRPKQYFVPPF
jgi:hypothetical protein